jgi:tetratricopeptide (TPR) repeat protein
MLSREIIASLPIDSVPAAMRPRRMTVDLREAVESLRLRLAQVRATGDPQPLLEPAALAAAWQLRALATDSADVAELVGWCHWTWYRCQPTGDDELHFHAALGAFAPLYPTRLGSVPSGLRALVGNPAAVADSHAELGLALQSNPAGMSEAAAAATAISAIRAAIAMVPGEDPARPKYLSNLSFVLQACRSLGGSEALLDEAVAASREALQLTPPDEPGRLGRVANLVGLLTERFRAGDRPADLDEAITAGRAALAEPTADGAPRARLAGNLAGALFARDKAMTADLAELAEAADLYRVALAGTPSNAPHRLSWQEGLCECDIRRYARSGQPADRDAAIGSVRDYVNAATDDSDRTTRLVALLHLLRIRVDESPAPGDLAEAITVGRQLVASDRLAGWDRFRALVDLGLVLRRRFDGTGAAKDLDDAIATGRGALAAADEMADGTVSSELPSLLINLAKRLNLRFTRSGQTADLTDAITFARRAVAATLPGDPARLFRASDLVAMLAARHDLAGDEQDLDDAVDLAREIATDTPSDHPHRPAMLHNLAGILARREPPDLDHLAAAIAAVDEAIELSAGTPKRPAPGSTPQHIGGLVVASVVDEAMLALAAAKIRFKRFLLTETPTELDDALAAVQRALSVTSAAHPDRPDLLLYRSTLLTARQERTHDPGDLAAALTVAREALADLAAGTVQRPLVQNRLGALLLARFQFAGDPDDLAQALAITQDALIQIPSDNANRFPVQANAGVMLIERFRSTGDIADLDQALAMLREVRDQRDVAPENQPTVLIGLANALDAHFNMIGDTADLDEAVVAATTAVTLAR